jgi:hypothetical protein
VATSTVSDFKAALLSRLQNRSGLSDVQITYGWPNGAVKRESIMLGGVNGTQTFRTIGATQKMEEYALTVYITVIREGSGRQQNCDERALAIMAEIENELRLGITVNNTVLTAELGAFDLQPMASAETREARLTVTINVMARI